MDMPVDAMGMVCEMALIQDEQNGVGIAELIIWRFEPLNGGS